MPVVIGETPSILAIHKPAGLIVHNDGRTEEDSVARWIERTHPQIVGVGEDWTSPQGERVPCPGIVHRLDRGTSGVLLVAKTQPAFEHLRAEFKARRVKKVYLALVHGHPEADRGTIAAEIMRSTVPPKHWYARPCEASDKRAAITEWCVIKRFADPGTGMTATLIEVEPQTGRTHQIRVHFASIGHALVGDHLYASALPSLFDFQRPALHAKSISCIDTDGAVRTFVAPEPDDFGKLQ